MVDLSKEVAESWLWARRHSCLCLQADPILPSCARVESDRELRRKLLAHHIALHMCVCFWRNTQQGFVQAWVTQHKEACIVEVRASGTARLFGSKAYDTGCIAQGGVYSAERVLCSVNRRLCVAFKLLHAS
jgi:hypothetical protein